MIEKQQPQKEVRVPIVRCMFSEGGEPIDSKRHYLEKVTNRT